MTGDFHIADWHVQPLLNSVRKGGTSVHIEPKVMQVLLQLAAHPDEVLSKEQLMRAVWQDTFVGEEVLTRCISEIRRVLQDDARAPRFVQTIPKVGYRLIATVDRADARPHSPGTTEASIRAGAADQTPTSPAAAAPEGSLQAPTGRRLAWAAALILGAALVLTSIWALHGKQAPQSGDFRTLPLTTYAGSQTQPVFSPDGNKVAFAWNGESDDRQSIYVKVIGTEDPVRLTNGPGTDYSPAWSPDGRFIAYLHTDQHEQGVYIIPSIGGPTREVASRKGLADTGQVSVTWSPDGKRLVFTDGKSAQSPSALFALDLDTLAVQKITTPDQSWDGDYNPVFSPDGQSIAFIRDIEASIRDIYILPAGGGEPRRLTTDNRQVSGLAWSSNGTSVIYSSDRGGKYALWRVRAKGGEPERLPVGTEDAYFPAIAPRGDRLAYVQASGQWNIMRVELSAPGKGNPTRLISSTEQDSAPRYSRDGTHIAFQSWRSGTQEIWVAASNGKDPVQLTSFGGPLTGSPSWSPDGQQITFDSRPDGRSHIYVVRAQGGVPRRITAGDHNDILPTWSRDMKSIYFASNRDGDWNIWKVPVDAGEPRQITRSGGFLAVESGDGWIYYTKADVSGIWRTPVSGGAEEKVLSHPLAGYWGYWSLSNHGIYYLDAASTPPEISFFETASKQTRRIYALNHVPPIYNGLSVDVNGRSLVYTDFTDPGSHITLVENFR